MRDAKPLTRSILIGVSLVAAPPAMSGGASAKTPSEPPMDDHAKVDAS